MPIPTDSGIFSNRANKAFSQDRLYQNLEFGHHRRNFFEIFRFSLKKIISFTESNVNEKQLNH